MISQFLNLYFYMTAVFSVAFVCILMTTHPLILRRVSKSYLNRLSRLTFVIALGSVSLFFSASKKSRLSISSGQFSSQLAEESLKQDANRSVRFFQLQQEQTSFNDTTEVFLFLSLLLGFSYFFCMYIRELFKLNSLIKKGYLWKRLGRLSILFSDDIPVPCAMLFGSRAYVMLPAAIADQPVNLRLSLLHELQHHRQADTLWVHILYGLRVFFFWNPLIYIVIKRIDYIQELACDEALVGRRQVSIHEYSGCLLEAARNAMAFKSPLVGTASMPGMTSSEILKKRIQSMTHYSERNVYVMSILSGLSVVLMSAFAYGSVDLFQQNTVGLDEAKTMVEKVRDDSGFPVEVNDLVLRQLNLYSGSDKGREYIRLSLERMQQYGEILNDKFEEYNAPKELLAVALVESGFRNLSQDNNSVRAAGIWQFIPDTARNYGLRVDDTIDERLDVEKETDAALRLLSALKLRFLDWRLALLAYNAGEGWVQRAINHVGSRDPWDLIRTGYKGDADYLAKVIAVMLLLKNQ